MRALRAGGAAPIVVAVPVGPRESVALVGEEADEIVCLTIPHELLGVGRWYRDFSPVSDAEVIAALTGASGQAPPTGETATTERVASQWPISSGGTGEIARALRH